MDMTKALAGLSKKPSGKKKPDAKGKATAAKPQPGGQASSGALIRAALGLNLGGKK